MTIGIICNLDAAMAKLIAYITYIVTTNQSNGHIGMINDILHYTGMGLEGDQKIDYAQNTTLAQIQSNNVEPFLFEVFQHIPHLSPIT